MNTTISIISGILLASSGIPYLVGISKGTLRPRPLSWLGWFLIMAVSLFAQIYESGFNFLMSVVIGSCIECLIVFVICLTKKNKTILRIDYLYLTLGLICLMVYVLSKNALITTVFSILADIFVSIPTLHNAFKDPRAESITCWEIGTVATGLSFGAALYSGTTLLKLYPTYLFTANFLTFILCLRRFKKRYN
jgi:hypothetical protein